MNNGLILVIEDEAALRKNIVEIIEHYGFRVISASTGEEGINLAEESIPDIIISDIMLPGIDGFEMFSRVKQVLQLKRTAFIFLTARSTRSDARAGMDMGADDYLTKPFTKEELISSVRTRFEKLSKLNEHQSKDNILINATSQKTSSLTKTEHKVLNEISEGRTTPQIAQKLFISKKTVENHRVNISRKLNLSGPNSLLRFALQLETQESGSYLADDTTSNSSIQKK